MSKLTLALAFALAAVATPSIVRAQDATDTTQTFLEFQVEQAARIKTASLPVYPERLRAAGVEGEVLVQFVVSESGNAQMSTFKVLRSNDNAFTEAVKRAVSASSFFPAQIRGKRVKQLVQQPYKFASSK
jgi:protein TonB